MTQEVSDWRSGRARLSASLASLVSLLFVVGGPPAALAQEWNFSQEIPCATAPVYGVPFTRCFASNRRTFRIGVVQSWLAGQQARAVELQIGGDTLKVSGLSSDEQRRLIDLFVKRHAH